MLRITYWLLYQNPRYNISGRISDIMYYYVYIISMLFDIYLVV